MVQIDTNYRDDNQYVQPASMNVSGSGTTEIVYKTTPSSETSREMQDAWTAQMTIINEIMQKIDSGEDLTGEDLDKLVAALKNLKDLAENGITDEKGRTSYITDRMVEPLGALFNQFEKVGIGPNLDVNSMNESAKKSLLEGAKSEDLTAALKATTKMKYENLSLAGLLFATMMNDVFPVFGKEFENLEEWVDITEEIMKLIGDIKDLGTNVEIVKDWPYDENLSNSAAIPPDAVADLKKALNNMKAGKGDDFEKAYKKDYEEASAAAKANGTTIQEEMAKKNGASKILTTFIQSDDKEGTRGAQLISILAATTAREVRTIPKLPDGKESWGEVTEDLLKTKQELEAAINDLRAKGADKDLIKSLDDIVKGIDSSMDISLEEAKSLGPIEVYEWVPPRNNMDPGHYTTRPATPEEIQNWAKTGSFGSKNGEELRPVKPVSTDKVNELFANKYINAVKIGGTDSGKGATVVDTALTRVMSRSEKDQKEHKKLMTALDNIMAVSTSIVKKSEQSTTSTVKKIGQ